MTNKDLIREIRFPYYDLQSIKSASECFGGSITNHKTLKGFLQIKWVGIDKPEIPILALRSFYALLHGKYRIEGADVISIPLIYNPLIPRNTSRVTNSTAILYRTYNVNFTAADKLICFTCPGKPYKYFSGRGILLKEEGEVITPLLLHTVSVKPNPNNFSPFRTHHTNLRISPLVFKNRDHVSKYITSKLIPALCDSLYDPIYASDKEPLTIIVEDLSKWILMPVKPNLTTHEQDLKDFYTREDTINEIIDSL